MEEEVREQLWISNHIDIRGEAIDRERCGRVNNI